MCHCVTNVWHAMLAIYDGPWMEIPDAFLPTKVLDLCLNIFYAQSS